MQAKVQTRQFVPKGGTGLKEYHSIIRAPRAVDGNASASSFAVQLQTVLEALGCIAKERNIEFVRFYLSDVANQQSVLENAVGAMLPALSGAFSRYSQIMG